MLDLTFSFSGLVDIFSLWCLFQRYLPFVDLTVGKIAL
jgi:hypothetical protein